MFTIGHHHQKGNEENFPVQKPVEKSSRPLVTLFHDEFEKGVANSQHTWKLSITMNKPVSTAQEYEVWWGGMI